MLATMKKKDAKEPIFVAVTSEDIDRGQPDDAYRDPVARAIKRATGSRWVEVYPDTLVVWLGEKCYGCKTPDSVKKFLKALDDGREVKPFGFSVTLKPRQD